MKNIFKKNHETEYVEITVCDYYRDGTEETTTAIFRNDDHIGKNNFMRNSDEVKSMRYFTK